MVYRCKSTDETSNVGAEFAKEILEDKYTVSKPIFVALYGDLGAGKTAFVNGMAKILAPDSNVSSPTYSLINLYDDKMHFYHMDLYRIKDEDDLYSIGFYEILDDTDAVIACEWSERIPSALPESYISVKISGQGNDEREINIERKG